MSNDNLSSDDVDRNRGRTLADKLENSDEGRDQQENSRDESGGDEATVRYTLDMPVSLHKQLKVQALVEEERSMKAVTIDALVEYLRRS